jgi:hypothetical protein
VNQSQIGVDIIDANDIGVAKGSCFMRFDHDEEVRSYFCKKFNGYKAKDLSFHHNRPGSIEFDNQYNIFPEIKVFDNPKTYYDLPDVGIIESEYNDSESFIPGDACGYIDTITKKVDYFYSLAPGTTSKFINYPHGNQTLSFGNNNPNNFGISMNRTQTPYYLYFGLIPGKTSLHKTIIPSSMLIGAILLLFCDILCQLPDRGIILPLNVVTSFIGTPVIIYLIVKSSKQQIA